MAAPVAAQPTTETVITFTVAQAELTIDAPDQVNLGAAFPGEEVEGQIGPIRVSDQRAAPVATWTVTVTATDFIRVGNTGLPEEDLPPGLVEYWSGPLLASTGTGTFLPGQLTEEQEVTLDQARVALRKTSGAGVNTATFNPTLEIDIPDTAVAGTYQGTVTHSVA
ncbi:hypothetical protein ACQEUR_08505 [Plantactinospora sp. CA-290183]